MLSWVSGFIPWLSIWNGVLKLSNAIAQIIHDNELMEAGRAQAHMEATDAALEGIAKAKQARSRVTDDPNDVLTDDANRDLKP